MQGVGDSHAALGCFIFHILGAQVVIQGSNGCFCPHFAPVNTGSQLVLENLAVVHTVVKTRQDSGRNRLIGIVSLENSGGNDVALFISGTFQSHAEGGVPQGVQHQTGLLLEGQMFYHVGSTDFGGIAPVFVGRQNAVVVHILEEQAVFYDDTAGGDADGRAVFVVEQHGLQVEIIDLVAFFQYIGRLDIAVFHTRLIIDRDFFHGTHSL